MNGYTIHPEKIPPSKSSKMFEALCNRMLPSPHRVTYMRKERKYPRTSFEDEIMSTFSTFFLLPIEQ
jgi:hypothetical protein